MTRIQRIGADHCQFLSAMIRRIRVIGVLFTCPLLYRRDQTMSGSSKTDFLARLIRLLALKALASLNASSDTSHLKRAEAVEPSGAGFPRTLLDGGGSEVAIRARPVRIVSQTLGTDEILWAICGRERIVGVSKIGLEPNCSPISSSWRATASPRRLRV